MHRFARCTEDRLGEWRCAFDVGIDTGISGRILCHGLAHLWVTAPFCTPDRTAAQRCNMTDERRKDTERKRHELRTDLNPTQQETLVDLERFGWVLKFVRRPLFQPSIPVVFDGDRKAFAVLEADGTLNEHPSFDIRGD